MLALARLMGKNLKEIDMADQQQIINDLIAVATGQVDHVYMGQCPDQIEGHEVRDPDCPACQAIMAAEHSHE